LTVGLGLDDDTISANLAFAVHPETCLVRFLEMLKIMKELGPKTLSHITAGSGS
jgi:hypothetical protein